MFFCLKELDAGLYVFAGMVRLHQTKKMKSYCIARVCLNMHGISGFKQICLFADLELHFFLSETFTTSGFIFCTGCFVVTPGFHRIF